MTGMRSMSFFEGGLKGFASLNVKVARDRQGGAGRFNTIVYLFHRI
jgi:hypothetical protein